MCEASFFTFRFTSRHDDQVEQPAAVPVDHAHHGIHGGRQTRRAFDRQGVLEPRQPGAVALFAETGKGGRQEALIRYPWKLIKHRETARTALFDLGQDPTERTEVSAQQPAVAAAMGELLDRWGQRVAHGGDDRGEIEPRLSPDQIERLRALGYL